MEFENQRHLQKKKEMEEGKLEEAEAKLSREAEEEGTVAMFPLPLTTSSSPCSSPSHDFSFTISFHSPSAAKTSSTRNRCTAFDLAPADDIFFHGHLLPLQLLSRPPPPASPRRSQDATARPPVQEKNGEQSSSSSSTNSSSSSRSSSAASSNGDAKERTKNKLLSSLLGGVGRWRKESEAREKEEDDDEKKRKRRAFDAISRLLRRYVSAVEPLFSFRGRRGRDMRRRPYSFAGNPSPGAAAGRAEEWRRRRGELSAPASMRTSPANSGLLVPTANPNVGGSSEESTMEELRSAIEAAIAHCKNSSVAMKDDKCKS